MPRLGRQIEGLDAALAEHVVHQLCVLEPDATEVLLTGSYAKGTAAVASDLDLSLSLLKRGVPDLLDVRAEGEGVSLSFDGLRRVPGRSISLRR